MRLRMLSTIWKQGKQIIITAGRSLPLGLGVNPNAARQGRAFKCPGGITLACALFAGKRLIFTDRLEEATPAATVRIAMIRDLSSR